MSLALSDDWSPGLAGWSVRRVSAGARGEASVLGQLESTSVGRLANAQPAEVAAILLPALMVVNLKPFAPDGRKRLRLSIRGTFGQFGTGQGSLTHHEGNRT
jgi:hypothetical protein